MLPLKECEALLNQNRRRYTPEEAALIRDFLYHMARLDHAQFIRWKKAGRPVHARIDGRAGKAGI